MVKKRSTLRLAGASAVCALLVVGLAGTAGAGRAPRVPKPPAMSYFNHNGSFELELLDTGPSGGSNGYLYATFSSQRSGRTTQHVFVDPGAASGTWTLANKRTLLTMDVTSGLPPLVGVGSWNGSEYTGEWTLNGNYYAQLVVLQS